MVNVLNSQLEQLYRLSLTIITVKNVSPCKLRKQSREKETHQGLDRGEYVVKWGKRIG